MYILNENFALKNIIFNKIFQYKNILQVKTCDNQISLDQLNKEKNIHLKLKF